MRALMAKERPARHRFDLKLVDGGLVDLEFIAQSAQLVASTLIARPQAPTATVLQRLRQRLAWCRRVCVSPKSTRSIPPYCR